MPDRPIDGVSLKPLIDGTMTERPRPICFWSYKPTGQAKQKQEPYIDPKLQEGTTPLVKMMAGRFTRNFQNDHHRAISDGDFSGPRAILGNRYKLVIDGQSGTGKELFDLRASQTEQENLIESKPEVARRLQQQLHSWQQSVLESLTGADYQ